MGSLVKYVAIGGVACLGVATLYKIQLNGKLRNVTYYKDALNMLNQHKACDLLLGKPIYTGNVDVFSKNNYADANIARIHLPVRGSKCKGELFFCANKNDSENKWVVTRIELEMKDKRGGTVLIFDTDEGSSSSGDDL